MLIPCPHCGPREMSEFTYAGDATLTRPTLDAPQDAWCAYLYQRRNPVGAHREYWQHTAGCRSVLIVERDTLTHEVHGAERAGVALPAPRESEPAE